MSAVKTTTTLSIKQMQFVKKQTESWDLFPFSHPIKFGKLMSSDTLNLIKGNRGSGTRFKVNLYASSLHRSSCVETAVPQRNETYFYMTPPSGTKVYFFSALREWNAEKAQFDSYGSKRTQWYIDCSDWSLHQPNCKWERDEYRIVLEPFDRAWNRAVVSFNTDGPVRINDSLTPTQYSAFRARVNDQEKIDTALLVRKHENQNKRKRARTPSPTFSRKRRNKILAHTTMQRMYTTAKLKHGNKMVFVTVGNFIHTYSGDALKLVNLKLAKHANRFADLHVVQYGDNDWPTKPQVFFPKNRLDFYRACCHQKGMRVIVV